MVVETLGYANEAWRLKGTLRGGNSNAQLLNAEVPFNMGFANFTDLVISESGSNYYIDFAISYPTNLPANIKAIIKTAGW